MAGRKKPGSPGRVRLSDIAAYVGCSRTTVASVLLRSAGKNARVGKETAARIREAAEELGYFPNAAAQRLAGKQGKTIGVVIDSYAPLPSYRQLAELERAADQEGYRIMIGQSHGELDKIRAYSDDFLANGIEGVICISHNYPDIGAQVAELFLRLPHVVFLGKPVVPPAHAGWVSIDHRAATKDLVAYMLSRGYENLMLCLSDIQYSSSQDRRDGFLDGLLAGGCAVRAEQVAIWDDPAFNWGDDYNHKLLKERVEQAISAGGIDGILANNDWMAMVLIRILREIGLCVPDDIAVAGYDNMPLTSVCTPSITTVDLSGGALANEGFRLLLELIGKKATNRYRTVQARVVPRESA